EKPRWWPLFQEQLPEDCRDRLDFLFDPAGWTAEQFVQQLGNEIGARLLTVVQLEWPQPCVEKDLFFDLDERNDVGELMQKIRNHSNPGIQNFEPYQRLDSYGAWAQPISRYGGGIYRRISENRKAHLQRLRTPLV